MEHPEGPAEAGSRLDDAMLAAGLCYTAQHVEASRLTMFVAGARWAEERAAVQPPADGLDVAGWPDRMAMLGELCDALGVNTIGKPPRELWDECLRFIRFALPTAAVQPPAPDRLAEILKWSKDYEAEKVRFDRKGFTTGALRISQERRRINLAEAVPYLLSLLEGRASVSAPPADDAVDARTLWLMRHLYDALGWDAPASTHHWLWDSAVAEVRRLRTRARGVSAPPPLTEDALERADRVYLEGDRETTVAWMARGMMAVPAAASPAPPASEKVHAADCAWTLATCEYKATHYYCPHPEHECTCGWPAPPAPVEGE